MLVLSYNYHLSALLPLFAHQNKAILNLYFPSFRMSFHCHFWHFGSVVWAAHFFHQDCYKKIQITNYPKRGMYKALFVKKTNKKIKEKQQNKTKKTYSMQKLDVIIGVAK